MTKNLQIFELFVFYWIYFKKIDKKYGKKKLMSGS